MARIKMLLLIVIMSVRATCALLVGPNNTVVLAGTAMTMTCEPSPGDEVIGWGVYTTAYKYVLLDNGCRAADAGVNDLKAYDDINGHYVGTSDTVVTHAGLYECLVSEARGSSLRTLTRANANLIVLESNPIGTITKAPKGNEITLHCSVAYSGFWPPTMEWRLNEQKEESTIVEKTKNHVSATLKIWPHETDRRRFSQYSCVTYFDASKKPGNSSATNVPSFVYTWTPHEPLDIKISPRKDKFSHSEQLVCSADAKPEAKYNWTNMDIGNVINGPILIVPPADGIYRFKCTADNGVGNVATSSISFTAEGSGSNQVFLYIVYAGVVLGAAILLPLIAVCIGKRRCAQAARNNRSAEVRVQSSSSAWRSRHSGKSSSRTVQSTADDDYDDIDDTISPSSNTAQGYVSLGTIPASDYTQLQTENKTA